MTTAEVLAHPWLSLPLTPEQQESWQRLQEEQRALDAQLQAESNPRAVSYARADVAAQHASAEVTFPRLGSLRAAGKALLWPATGVCANARLFRYQLPPADLLLLLAQNVFVLLLCCRLRCAVRPCLQ